MAKTVNTPGHNRCLKETEISAISTKLTRVEKVVMDGNGQEALIYSVPKLTRSVDQLSKDIPDLTTAVSGLVRFKDEVMVEEKLEERRKIRNRYVITTLIGLLGIALGIIFSK